VNASRIAVEEKKEDLIAQLRQSSFLKRCRAGTVSRKELMAFLVQQSFYSRHFTKYLCALMSNLPETGDIMSLATNLFDELGLDGQADSVPHHIVYRRMLERFELSPASETPTPETDGLIAAMLTHCRNPDPAYGLGALCLGAEGLVPSIYTDIVCGFTAIGVPAESVDFFHIHIACDDRHAETLQEMMLDLVARNPAKLPIILEAGQALVAARGRFFNGIERLCSPQKSVALSADA